jgi:hypothetical protein
MSDLMKLYRKTDAARVPHLRAALDRNVTTLGKSSASEQVGFLKELIENPTMRREFERRPGKVAAEQGVVLDRKTIRQITDSILFDYSVKTELRDSLDDGALKDLESLRNATTPSLGEPSLQEPSGSAAAVAAGAAVVAAAAAVVMAVVAVWNAARGWDGSGSG